MELVFVILGGLSFLCVLAAVIFLIASLLGRRLRVDSQRYPELKPAPLPRVSDRDSVFAVQCIPPSPEVLWQERARSRQPRDEYFPGLCAFQLPAVIDTVGESPESQRDTVPSTVDFEPGGGDFGGDGSEGSFE